MLMNPYAFISLLSSIVALFLGNFIYYKNPNNRLKIENKKGISYDVIFKELV